MSVLSELIQGSVANVATVAVANALSEGNTHTEKVVATLATLATFNPKPPFATATLATLATVEGLEPPFATATLATLATVGGKAGAATATVATLATVDGYAWEERAAIAEFDGGLSRADAERLADASSKKPVSSSFPSPGAGYVRCCDCRHAVSAPLDEPGAWRTCAAGQRAGWGFQERVCSTWESAP